MQITLPWLVTPDQPFPHPACALEEPNGLLCGGGDLSLSRLLSAYAQGIFPWYEEDQPILWWSPDPRCILDFADLHVSTSMRRLLRRSPFSYTFDQAFDQVVAHCAAPRASGPGTWITPEMREAYGELHRQGFAHSIEVRQDEVLVGGLYGVSLGSSFFGESMFSTTPNASKAAFIVLARHLRHWGFRCLDCQVTNPHLLSLGAREVSRDWFLSILGEMVRIDCNPSWQIQDALLH